VPLASPALQISGGIGGSFNRQKSVNCHVGMYAYEAAHLKLIAQSIIMLETSYNNPVKFFKNNSTYQKPDLIRISKQTF
jgi:hypothetical protein